MGKTKPFSIFIEYLEDGNYGVVSSADTMEYKNSPSYEEILINSNVTVLVNEKGKILKHKAKVLKCSFNHPELVKQCEEQIQIENESSGSETCSNPALKNINNTARLEGGKRKIKMNKPGRRLLETVDEDKPLVDAVKRKKMEEKSQKEKISANYYKRSKGLLAQIISNRKPQNNNGNSTPVNNVEGKSVPMETENNGETETTTTQDRHVACKKKIEALEKEVTRLQVLNHDLGEENSSLKDDLVICKTQKDSAIHELSEKEEIFENTNNVNALHELLVLASEISKNLKPLHTMDNKNSEPPKKKQLPKFDIDKPSTSKQLWDYNVEADDYEDEDDYEKEEKDIGKDLDIPDYDEMVAEGQLLYHKDSPNVQELFNGCGVYILETVYMNLIKSSNTSTALCRSLVMAVFKEEALITSTCMGKKDDSDGLHKGAISAILRVVTITANRRGWKKVPPKHLHKAVNTLMWERRSQAAKSADKNATENQAAAGIKI